MSRDTTTRTTPPTPTPVRRVERKPNCALLLRVLALGGGLKQDLLPLHLNARPLVQPALFLLQMQALMRVSCEATTRVACIRTTEACYTRNDG